MPPVPEGPASSHPSQMLTVLAACFSGPLTSSLRALPSVAGFMSTAEDATCSFTRWWSCSSWGIVWRMCEADEKRSNSARANEA